MSNLPIAIIGAGPVGLAAAAHLLARNLDCIMLESGASVGTAPRAWGHVRMFSPWRYNIDVATRTLLARQGWSCPALDQFPTGRDLVAEYLEPLARTPEIATRLKLNAHVTAITRTGLGKVRSAGRDAASFEIRVEDAQGDETRVLPGDGVAGLLATMSSVGTTLLMLHFLSRLAAIEARHGPALPTWGLSLPWLVTVPASIVVPWGLFLNVMGGTVSDVLSPAALWSSVWPVLLGAVLALGLRRWGGNLPRVPEGDVVEVIVGGTTHVARAIGLMLEWLDAVLRQWPVAGMLLLMLAVVLAGLMQIGH